MLAPTIWVFLAVRMICGTPLASASRNWRSDDSYFSPRNLMSDHFSRSKLVGRTGKNFFYSESCRTGSDGRTLCSSSTSRNNGPIKQYQISSESLRTSSNRYRDDPLNVRNGMTGPFGQSLFSSSGQRKESYQREPFPSRSSITGLYGPNSSNLRNSITGSVSQYTPNDRIYKPNPFHLRDRVHSSYEKSQYSSTSQKIQPFSPRKPYSELYAENVLSTRSQTISPYGQNPIDLQNPVSGSASQMRSQYRQNEGPYSHNLFNLGGKLQSEQTQYSSKSQLTQRSFSSKNPFADPYKQKVLPSRSPMTGPHGQNHVDLRNSVTGLTSQRRNHYRPNLSGPSKPNYDIAGSRSRKQNEHAFTSRAASHPKQNFFNRSGLINLVSGAPTPRLASKQAVPHSVRPEFQKLNPYPKKD